MQSQSAEKGFTENAPCFVPVGSPSRGGDVVVCVNDTH